MRAVVNVSDLAPIVRWHVSQSSLQPLKATVSDDGKHLTIESCTDQVWRRSTVDLEEGTDGEAVFGPARLVDQLKTAKADTATVELSGSTVRTRVGRSSATVPVVRDIPGYWAPHGAIEMLADADKSDLMWAFKAASVTVGKSTDASAEGLKAVLLRINTERVTVLSTDCYRLTRAEHECMTAQDGAFLVPPAAFTAALGQLTDPVQLVHSDGHPGLSDGRNTMLSRVYSEEGYPAVESVFDKNKKCPQGIELRTRDLMDAIDSTGAGVYGQVDLFIHDSHVTVCNVSSEDDSHNATGQVETDIDASVAGVSGGVIRVNKQNLHAMLKVIRTSSVGLHTNGKHTKPMVLTESRHDEDGTCYTGMIMLVNRPQHAQGSET